MRSSETISNQTNLRADIVIEFWEQAGPEKWFVADTSFDQEVTKFFHFAPDEALAGTYDHWAKKAHECLALIIVLDQFPRNIYRGTPKAFSYDEMAKAVAQDSIDQGFDQAYELPLKRLIYLPFMHSEKLDDQLYCIELCEKANDPDGVKFGEIHLDVIEKFNRFPHRNETLGRQSTPEEMIFLQEGGFRA